MAATFLHFFFWENSTNCSQGKILMNSSIGWWSGFMMDKNSSIPSFLFLGKELNKIKMIQ
jgi:hypothetical protein